jgi:hypothetical protein
LTRYKVEFVQGGSHGQSYDRLEGEVKGPVPVDAEVLSDWRARWPNFQPSELASGPDHVPVGRRALMIYVPALDALQAMRTEIGKPFTITSAYRTWAHNKAVGGGKRSRHLAGAAFDIARRAFAGMTDAQIETIARKHGFNGIGFYRTFVHVDMRAKPAKWVAR